METTNPTNSYPTIKKSNDLIEARYRLSIWEQRLIFTLLSYISPQDEDFKRYRIRVDDFAAHWGLDSDHSLYEKVQAAADELVGRTIQLSDDPKVSETVSWLAYVKYVRGSGEIEMEFHSELKPYLLQLKGHYTHYPLEYIANFRSQYSSRIYEVLKMEVFKHQHSFKKTFSYTDFRQILAIAKKEYTLFANFRMRIIEPSVKEISSYTDLTISEVSYGKTGRKVTHITFCVEIKLPAEQASLQADMLSEQSEEHPVVEQLVSLGFSLETAKKYKTKYGVKRIERNIAYTLAKKQEGLINDIPSYLNKAIVEDMGGAWEVIQTKAEQAKAEKEARAAKREAQAARAHQEMLEQLAAKADKA